MEKDLFGDDAVDTPETSDEVQEETVQKQEAAPAKKEEEASATADNFSFDMSDLAGDGVVVGDLGVQVSRLPVERAKFVKSAKSLISIVVDKVVCVKTHYREGIGSYICFGGQCCEMDGLPKVRYLFPIVVYDTDAKGKPKSADVEFKTLCLGRESYESLQTISELNGKLSGMDLMVVCSDEKYQKVNIQYAGPCRYRKSAKTVKKVVEFWQAHMKDLVLPVAAKKTLEQLTKAAPTGEVETRADLKLDDVFND